MGMAEPTAFHTGDSVREIMERVPTHWPRYETAYGELLVTPAPRVTHQRVVLRLLRALAEYVDREGLGEVLMAPADISWGRPDVLVQPDVFVVPRPLAGGTVWASITHLLLAVEVLSPGSGRADRFTKRRLYQVQGVSTYWMVDTSDAAVHVWTPDAQVPSVERDVLVWHPAGAGERFALPVAEFLGAP